VADTITKIFYPWIIIHQIEKRGEKGISAIRLFPFADKSLYNLKTVSIVVCFSFLFVSSFIIISASHVTISELAVLPDGLNPNRDSFYCIIEIVVFQGKIPNLPKEDQWKL